MKRQVIMGLLVLIPGVVFAQASDWEVLGGGAQLTGSVDVQWQSKYVWRGFTIFGDKSAVQFNADVDLYSTGFGINVQGHRANSSGYEDGERWDYCGYYQGLLFEEEIFQTNYRAGWVYYNYPKRANEEADLQEIQVIGAWPYLTGIEGLVPSYALVKLWPSRSGGLGGNASGFAHILMLDYSFDIPGLTPETPEQTIKLHSELVFNDGVHPGGGVADHDWSNLVLGASTDFELGYGLTFSPGAYYQFSMDDSVNPDDEAWVTLGLKYTF